MAAVRTDWAETLGGFSGADIAYAMENLPDDRPPTVGQFRALCRRAPAPMLPRLDAPVTLPSPEVAERIARLRASARRAS
jgi:hypothetical protein